MIDSAGVIVLDATTPAVDDCDGSQTFPPAQAEVAWANYDLASSPEGGQGDASVLLGRSDVQNALNGTPATALRSYSWAPHRRVLYAAYPVRDPTGEVVSVVYLASPLPRLSLSLLPGYAGF